MQVVMETDEAWSLMSVVTSYVIDRSGIAQDGKQRIRKWRADRDEGTPAMRELALAMNRALGTFIEEQTDRQIRRKGRYTRKKEATR